MIGSTFFYFQTDSPIGILTLISDGKRLNAIEFPGFDCNGYIYGKSIEVLNATEKWLEIYFNGGIPNFTVPMELKGTEFQKTVWSILTEIPYGETVTYSYVRNRYLEVAGIENMAAQAIGGAIEKNPIPIIVPCHRVIGSNGKLTGYRGGIDTKAFLLNLEGCKEYNS